MSLFLAIVFAVGPLYSAYYSAERQDWEAVKKTTSNLLSFNTGRLMYIASCFRTKDYNGVVDAVESSPLDRIGEFEIVAYTYALYKLKDPDTRTLIQEARRVAPYLDDFLDYIDMNHSLNEKRIWRAHNIALNAAARWKLVDRTTVFTYVASVITNHPRNCIEVLKAALPNMGRSDSARAFLFMGKAYRRLCNTSTASHYFKLTLVHFPETPYSIEAAKYVKGYATAKAKAYFFNRQYSRALKYAPSYSDVRLMIYYKKRRYSSFMRRYDPRKKHDPRVYLYAARIYKSKKQFLRARREYLKAIKNSDDGDVRRVAIIEVTNLIIRRRDFVGLNLLKDMAGDSDQFMNFRIGLVAYAFGHRKEAIKYFEKAESADGSKFWRTAALFWLYKLTKKGRYRYRATRIQTYSYYTIRAYGGEIKTAGFGNWARVNTIRDGYHAKRGKFFALLGFVQWAIDEADDGDIRTAYDIGRYAERIGDYRISIATASKAVDKANSPLPVEVLRVAYPCLFHSRVAKYSKRYRINPGLLLGLMREESRFMHKIVSRAGAVGLTQVMPRTARKIWRRIHPEKKFYSSILRDPDANIKIGAYHLRELLSIYGNEIYVLAAYNAGKGRVDAWKGYMPFLDSDLFV